MRRLLTLAILALAITQARAGQITMREFRINDYLIGFYDGRPPPAPRPAESYNWAVFGPLEVGVATYGIRRGGQALVYDTFPTAPEAKWVRDYLARAGVRHFTLVNSHWHLDHVGGNAVYADVDRIATDKTIQLLVAKKA